MNWTDTIGRSLVVTGGISVIAFAKYFYNNGIWKKPSYSAYDEYKLTVSFVVGAVAAAIIIPVTYTIIGPKE